MNTAWILQRFSFITGEQHTSPNDSSKIQLTLEFVGKCWKKDLLLTKLQRTPMFLAFSENYVEI
jgi:hypothetical protein